MNVKIGVMQPYIFPYIGYFQLINLVDKFVFYDDVNFKKRSWINRNKILINNKGFLFTIPLSQSSQNISINKICISHNYNWKRKFLLSLEKSYHRAPFFKEIFSIVQQVFSKEKKMISEMCIESVTSVLAYLDIQTLIIKSSSIYQNKHMKGQDRIIDICKKENSDIYYNLIGGLKLYDREKFFSNGISLKFIRAHKSNYKQFTDVHTPNLSILDILMFNSKEQIKTMLDSYNIINPFFTNNNI